MIKKILQMVAIYLILTCGIAFSKDITDKVDIPETGMMMVDSDGRSYFISKDGRYVIQGLMLDTWTGIEILNVADFRSTKDKVETSKVGLDADQIFNLTYGQGPKEVFVFVAPGCRYCANTMAQMEGLDDEYTFRLVPLPILGEKSRADIAALTCSTDQVESSLAALMGENYGLIPVATKGYCQQEKLKESMTVSQTMAISSVPFLVSHDGRTKRGAPASLRAFLEGSE